MTFSLDQVYLLGDFYKLNKTSSDGTCWENLQEAFFDVGCYFILIGRFYILRIFLHATSSPPWLLRALKAYTSFELYPGYFRLLYFCKAFPSHFIASATVLSGRFLPTGVFYLALFPHIVARFVTQMRAGTPHLGPSSVPALPLQLTQGLELLIL